MRKIIITGILGQDGANMAEYLLRDKSNHVYGMMRRVANPNYDNISKFKKNKNFKQVTFGGLVLISGGPKRLFKTPAKVF